MIACHHIAIPNELMISMVADIPERQNQPDITCILMEEKLSTIKQSYKKRKMGI